VFKILELLKSFLPNLENLPIPSASIAGPRWLFGIFGVVALSLYGLSLGRTRAILSLLSLYSAFVIIKLFPYFEKIEDLIGKEVEAYWIKLGIFLTAFIIIFVIFSFSFLSKRMASSEFSLFWIILISIIQFGFLISIVLSLLPEEIATAWSFGFYNYFGTSTALFVWAISPLPVLIFIRKK